MTMRAPQQLTFGFDDTVEPDVAPMRVATATETQCAVLFSNFLLGKSGSHETYVHALFHEIMPRSEVTSEHADILTHHLLGFPAGEAHAFSQPLHEALGAVWEALVIIIYEQAFPGQLKRDWTLRLAQVKGKTTTRRGSHAEGELVLGDCPFTTTYRTATFSASPRQQKLARQFAGRGSSPLLLSLRSSPAAPEYRLAGWDVLEAEVALEKIRNDTGIDPEAVVYLAASQDALRGIRNSQRERMYERVRDVCLGHYRKSGRHIAEAIHRDIARDPQALADILLQALDEGTLTPQLELLTPLLKAAADPRRLREVRPDQSS